jgi:hypothetical protein
MPKRRKNPAIGSMCCTTRCLGPTCLSTPTVLQGQQGAAGVDCQRFEDIEAYGEDQRLGELTNRLRTKTYEPQRSSGSGYPSRTARRCARWEFRSAACKSVLHGTAYSRGMASSGAALNMGESNVCTGDRTVRGRRFRLSGVRRPTHLLGPVDGDGTTREMSLERYGRRASGAFCNAAPAIASSRASAVISRCCCNCTSRNLMMRVRVVINQQ